MSGRPGPRRLGPALDAVVAAAAPATLLAGVQGVWAETAGPVVAAEAQPVAERDGIVTFACESGVWAQELELLGPDLLERLRTALGGPASGADRLRGLRFTAGGRRQHG